jgi:ABC-type nitrate/sulfonate/bicarbonate transport system permease component
MPYEVTNGGYSLSVILRSIAKVCAPFALLILLWTLAGHFSRINPALLPRPMEVADALNDLLLSGGLIWDVAWSLRRAALGLVCGGALGLLVGTVTGRIGVFNWLLTPVFNGFRALPPVAIVPLVVVWAGLGEPAKVFITSWAAFFPVWLNTHAGVSSVDKMIIWAARSLGARQERLLFAVTFPAALPQVLVGLRLAISSTLICVIVAEMTGAYAGLGYRLQTSYLVLRVDRMLACMVVLAAIGVLSDRLFNLGARRAFPWIALTHDRQ